MPKTYITAFCFIVLLHSCAPSKFGSAEKEEKFTLKVIERKDILTEDNLKNQPVPIFSARGAGGRGIDFTGVTGYFVSMAADAVKSIISNEQKKYTATYEAGLSDLYFYDQLSNDSPFDPTGMQFFGFTITRTFTGEDGKTDTAFAATFEIDTTQAVSVVNNAMFRLRLKDFHLYYAKAKVAEKAAKTLNMDVEISFNASYIDNSGHIYNNATIGKSLLLIRQAPLDATSPGYQKYYDGLKGQLLSGNCFLIPRSFGYHLEQNELKSGYNRGLYSIAVSVKECSKDVFTKKILVDNVNLLIDAGKSELQKAIDNTLQK